MVALDRELMGQVDLSFDNVRTGYRHYGKVISPGDPFAPANALLKWYGIGFEHRAIAAELEEQARTFLLEELDSGNLTLDNELGFVILHDCGDVVFLIVATWRGSNELWETVYVMDTFNGDSFAPLAAGTHRPTFCVWEMGAVWHETQAWSRYLYSARGYSDRDTWLADSDSGAI